MGSYLDKPITEKETHDGEGNGLSFGVSAMQGWRVTMEVRSFILLLLELSPVIWHANRTRMFWRDRLITRAS
jgi:hypothetical protein